MIFESDHESLFGKTLPHISAIGIYQVRWDNLPNGQFPWCFQYGRYLPGIGSLDRTLGLKSKRTLLPKYVVEAG